MQQINVSKLLNIAWSEAFFARKPLMKQINVFMGKLHKMHPNYMANLLSAMTLLSVITQNYTMQFFNELKKLQGHF